MNDEARCPDCKERILPGISYCMWCGAPTSESVSRGAARMGSPGPSVKASVSTLVDDDFYKRYSKDLAIEGANVLVMNLRGRGRVGRVEEDGISKRLPIDQVKKVQSGHLALFVTTARITMNDGTDHHAPAPPAKIREFVHDVSALRSGDAAILNPATVDDRLKMLAAGIKICPSCGEHRIDRKMKATDSAMTGVAIVLLFTVIGTVPALLYLLFVKKSYQYRCKACGYSWEPREPEA